MLTRETILAARVPTAEVTVEAWGGAVTIRALSVAELEQWRAAQDDPARAKAGEGMAMLVALSVIDGENRPLFTEADVAALATQPPVMLRPVVEAILKLNGLDAAAREALAGN